MISPFFCGQLAIGDHFVGQKSYLDKLISNFESLRNTILISPRGWGKTSLVYKAATLVEEQNCNYRACFIDLNNVYSTHAFSKAFLRGLSRAGVDEYEINKGSRPEVDEILNLSELTAIRYDMNLIICISNFQNIIRFKNGREFLRKIVKHWRKHNRCAYCLSGNRYTMETEMIYQSIHSLHVLGRTFRLQKTKVDELVTYIQVQFKDHNKRIPRDVARMITITADCHPFYVQLLSWYSWSLTNDLCTESIVNQAKLHILNHFSIYFQAIIDSLTNNQISFLKAVLENAQNLCSMRSIQAYNLGTSANVVQIKKSLCKKEIIEVERGTINMLDPMLEHWLKQYFF